MKSHLYLWKMILGFPFENKHFRLAQIFSHIGMGIMVIMSILNIFLGGDKVAHSPLFFGYFVGLTALCIAFYIMTLRGGIGAHWRVNKEIRKKPADITYLEKVRDEWDYISAITLYRALEEFKLSPYWAVRWAGIIDKEIDGISFDFISPHIIDFSERNILPQNIKMVWDVGVRDINLLANFAENDIDETAIRSTLEGSI